MTYANMITFLRLCMAPVVAYLFLLPDTAGLTSGLFLLLAAGFTDVIDGYVARKRKEITELGKVIDPLADKAVIISCLVALSMKYSLSWWLSGFYIIKEFLQVTVGAVFFAGYKQVISANLWGKSATVGFYMGIILFLLPVTQKIRWLWMLFFTIAVLLSITAAFSYAVEIKKR